MICLPAAGSCGLVFRGEHLWHSNAQAVPDALPQKGLEVNPGVLSDGFVLANQCCVQANFAWGRGFLVGAEPERNTVKGS